MSSWSSQMPPQADQALVVCPLLADLSPSRAADYRLEAHLQH